MILSDTTIRTLILNNRIVVDPKPADRHYQPCTLELTLGSEFLSPYQNTPREFLKYYTITPGECVLATTEQRIELPDDIVARVEGKSSWGRKFIQVHSTAGLVDPSFRGTITLELTNLSEMSVTLPVGGPIAQLSFEWLDNPCARGYGHPGLDSHYQDQSGVTASALP